MASSRKTGKLGALYLHSHATAPDKDASIKIADTYNWKFDVTADVEECTRKGEGHKRYEAGAGSASFTCQAHITALGALALLAQAGLQTVAQGGAVAAARRVAFRLITLNTSAVGVLTRTPTGQQEIKGIGYVTRGSLEAVHDSLIVDDFEVQVDGNWTTGPTT
jgi:hypothetical protein